MGSTMQVTKTCPISGMRMEMAVAVTTKKTLALQDKDNHASGWSAQLVRDIFTPAEASVFLLYSICLLFECSVENFLPFPLLQIQDAIRQQLQCEAACAGICQVAFLLLPLASNVGLLLFVGFFCSECLT